jgi:hypothetical protein
VKLDRWSDQYPPTLQVCNLLRRSDCSSKATRHGRARPSCARASRQALPVLDRQQAGAECRMMARRKRRAAGAGARQSAAMMVSRARQLQLPSFAVSRSCSIDRPPQHVPAGPAAAGQATTTGQRPHPSRKVAQLWLCGKPLPAVPLRPACPGNRGRGRLGFCRYSDTASYLLNPHAILPCDLN